MRKEEPSAPAPAHTCCVTEKKTEGGASVYSRLAWKLRKGGAERCLRSTRWAALLGF